jgi:hypothetical protein
VDRGLQAEEEATLQDLYSLAATIALESGDAGLALKDADAALQASMNLSGSGSYPNRYWAIFHLCRTYLILWKAGLSTASRDALAAKSRASLGLLKRLSSAHPVAVPSGWLVRGGNQWVGGRRDQALKSWQRAQATASAMDMPYEARLAERELARGAFAEARLPEICELPLLDLMSRSRPQFGHRSDRPAA